MKLCNDDLPLKLGQRLPRPEEKAKNIAEMERVAKVFDDTAVKWVDGNEDAVQISDCRHPRSVGVDLGGEDESIYAIISREVASGQGTPWRIWQAKVDALDAMGRWFKGEV